MKKTVLITGASSGIGKAAAKLFASNNWNVIATMRTPDAEKDLICLNDVLVTRLDVQERDSIHRAIEAGIARFGKIDTLINNAGFSLFGVFEAISREKIQEQFGVNVLGVMDVTRAILPHFRKNKSGLIINISSRAAWRTRSRRLATCEASTQHPAKQSGICPATAAQCPNSCRSTSHATTMNVRAMAGATVGKCPGNCR